MFHLIESDTSGLKMYNNDNKIFRFNAFPCLLSLCRACAIHRRNKN